SGALFKLEATPARGPSAKLPLGRDSTLSDRFYTPALIRPTSGSDGSCHPLWNVSAASHQRYWLPRKVHASSFMELHDGYSRKVSAYTDLETALYTLFDGSAKQLSSWCVRMMGRWVNRCPEIQVSAAPGTLWTVTDDGAGASTAS